MVLTDGNGLPLGVTISSASPAEVKLIESLVDSRLLRRRVRRLIYDRAADSDPLRKRLLGRGIELICPHRRNCLKRPTQDGRPPASLPSPLESRALDQLAPKLSPKASLATNITPTSFTVLSN
jgi:hypothetical protein